MKKLAALLCIIIISAATSFYVTGRNESQATEESAYDRVMRTGTIRCAYWTFPPISVMDPNTKKLGGFTIAMFEELAKRLALKVEWVEEVTFGTMVEGLKTNRYDAVCTGSWLIPAQVKGADFTVPYLYSALVPAVRADETRFDTGIDALNKPDVKFATMDDGVRKVVQTEFPNATIYPSTSTVGPAQVFVDVETRKADATLNDLGDFLDYSHKNPGKLKMLDVEPVRLYPWVVLVRSGEPGLVNMLNAGLLEMVNGGEVQDFVKQSGLDVGVYYYVKPSITNQ
jgi:ABC-type amino acid transport substrate-binding protein